MSSLYRITDCWLVGHNSLKKGHGFQFSDDKFSNALEQGASDFDMATTYDEEKILQQLQHLNDSQHIFDFLFNNNNTPDVSKNNKYFPGTAFQCRTALKF